jgi:hypothetical protein
MGDREALMPMIRLTRYAQEHGDGYIRRLGDAGTVLNIF